MTCSITQLDTATDKLGDLIFEAYDKNLINLDQYWQYHAALDLILEEAIVCRRELRERGI